MDDSSESSDKDENTISQKLKEMKWEKWNDFEQARAERHVPLAVKIVPWVFAGFCAAVIFGMWVQMTVEIGKENSNNPNPYRHGCLILNSVVG